MRLSSVGTPSHTYIPCLRPCASDIDARVRHSVRVCVPHVQAQSNLAVVPQEPSTVAPFTQAACAEEKDDQVSPGPSIAPPSDSPSTPATVPEGDASPVASTAQMIAQTAPEAAGEEPAGDSTPAEDAVDGQDGLRWRSLMESKLDRALQALASLAASVDGRLDEISASLGTPAAWSTRVVLTEGTLSMALAAAER